MNKIKYDIVINDYKTTKDSLVEIEKKLNKVFIKDSSNPNFVFVLGGDGTFLKAVRKYENLINEIVFIPFKSGGIGYYTNKNRLENLDTIISSVLNNDYNFSKLELLEVIVNNEKKLVLNELKILNETNAIYLDILINDEYLETFHGTGLVISTSNGSTGYMKAAGGAVILSKTSGIYQLQELVPISTNIYRTLNAPLILTKEHKMKLNGEAKGQKIIIDTIPIEIKSDEILVSLSNKFVKILSDGKNDGEYRMKNVLIIGEALIDRYSNKDDIKNEVGGASFNVACCISKIGENSIFLGSIGNDKEGEQILSLAKKFNTNLNFVQIVDSKTTVALVTLDENNDRNFEFLRGADENYKFKETDFQKNKIEFIHFGSATAFLGGNLEQSYYDCLEYAIKNKIEYSFDPNFRDKL
ncbi:hypothetical protein FQR65_LT15359 [Abscondita terminalis]|nr:hypothetical protein FQR65_LT15359 [Abscondita terminalis]